MNIITESKSRHYKNNKISVKKFFRNFFTLPFEIGLYGFSAIFTVIVTVRILSYILKFQEVFRITINDLLFSLWGFIIFFLFTILKHFKKY
ncbi:hypothetical protein BMS3Abin04_01126 [bacterium BMS3Abin04]|nr:hypothetical protein BMS3Abin04_01126 [bacterium BMS3Abin04]